jgi:hypothetical protein
MVPDDASNPAATISGAGPGALAVAMSKDDLESFALWAGRQAVKAFGITLEELTLSLTSGSEHSLDVEALLKVRKGLSGSFHLRGHVELNSQMSVTVSGLSAVGTNLIGKIAAGVVQAKLAPLEGKTFKLGEFSLGAIKLRDVKIEAKDPVRVILAFG